MPDSMPEMTRRDAARLIAASTASLAPAMPPPRPNVLVLHCHDLGQFLGCYGVPTVETPNLDAFAASGVLFERNFCTAPQCSPSRASIFTGRYPHSNGVMGLTHANFAWDLHAGEQHLGQLLGKAGYNTAGVGVIHETRSGAARCGLANYKPIARADQAADVAIAQLANFAANPGKPFYMQVGFIEPHRLNGPSNSEMGFLDARIEAQPNRPVTVPGYLRDTPGTRTELAELQAAVRHADRHMGRILKALDEHKLAHNTLVVFTADHGVAMPRAKCSLYDPGLETPLILRWPARNGWSGGKRLRPMISNIDNVPSILDAAGVAVPANVQGRSFAALLDGGAYTPREEVFAEISYHDYYDPRRAIRTETHKLIVNFTAAPAFMDPSQSWRPRSDTVTPANHATAYHPLVELYDLRADKWEQNNIAPKAPQVVRELQQRLAKHLAATKDPILDGAITPPLHTRALAFLRGDEKVPLG